MTNAKNTKTAAPAKNATAIEKTMTVADVARELKLDEKRARSYLRKNESLYAPFRNKKFTKSSALYKQALDVLGAYAKKSAVITK